MCSEGELADATALSAIVHPKNPRLPSSHLHLSYTKIHKGKGFWRLMADLNPSIKNEAHKIKFDQMLENVSGEFYLDATENGNKYELVVELISKIYKKTKRNKKEEGTTKVIDPKGRKDRIQLPLPTGVSLNVYYTSTLIGTSRIVVLVLVEY